MDLHSPLAVNGAVVESLLELRQNPAWHGYGGFKKGYLAQVRTMVENKLPGRRFKLSHIRCEVNFLKNKYFAISDMVSSGGFAWDEEKMMLICDQSKYDEWVMANPTAKGLYGTRFFFYDELKIIYGEDHATGASDNSERKNRRRKNVKLGDLRVVVDLRSKRRVVVRMEPQVGDFEECESPFTRQPSDRRRKFDEISPSVPNFCRQVRNRVMEENRREENEKEVAELQVKLDNELSKIEGLSAFEVFHATNILASKHDLLRVFFGMSEERKKLYVLNLLEHGL
ncbi:hypothetical protein UlMin_008746 [Ulmus minor]